jgi:hypothetical protein
VETVCLGSVLCFDGRRDDRQFGDERVDSVNGLRERLSDFWEDYVVPMIALGFIVGWFVSMVLWSTALLWIAFEVGRVLVKLAR